LRVALTPERIPRLVLGVEARGSGSGVKLVDLARARALERERELVAGLALPVGPEAPDDFLGVEHETRAARKSRLDMSFAVLREVDAEQAVEGDRLPEVGRDDPDGVQLRYFKTLARCAILAE
jgi:hypothetical protein